jgi:hypothetical protein
MIAGEDARDAPPRLRLVVCVGEGVDARDEPPRLADAGDAAPPEGSPALLCFFGDRSGGVVDGGRPRFLAAGDLDCGEDNVRGCLRPPPSGVTGDTLLDLLPFWLPLGDVPIATAGEEVRGEGDALLVGVWVAAFLGTCGDANNFSCFRGERDTSLDEGWGDAAREPVGDAGLEDVGETGTELSPRRNGDLTS